MLCDSRNGVRRLRLVRFEIGAPLHGCRVFAHGRLTDGLQISRHAGESIRAFAKNNCFSIRVSVDNARSLGNIICRGEKGRTILTSVDSPPPSTKTWPGVFDGKTCVVRPPTRIGKETNTATNRSLGITITFFFTNSYRIECRRQLSRGRVYPASGYEIESADGKAANEGLALTRTGLVEAR